MTPFQKTKPSFLEGGMPAASLSAECQRDNNARQRPPQNRLHIWWARRPPTICRAAILSALLPHDLELPESALPIFIAEPTEGDLHSLTKKLIPYRSFFESLLNEVPATQLTPQHSAFLRSLGIKGDASAAYRRMALRDEQSPPHQKIPLPDSLVYRHPPATTIPPSNELIDKFLEQARSLLGFSSGDIVMLDFMAGGGAIPIEGIRHGIKVYANDLNPVAALVLKATLEYPARFGNALIDELQRQAALMNTNVAEKLKSFFTTETAEVWWPEISSTPELKRLRSKQVVKVEPAGSAVTADYLWLRTVTCQRCSLNIPISTNFHIVSKKGQPEKSIAAFPVVPSTAQGNDCTFRIVKQADWQHCRWPRPGFDHWHPRNTPTFKDGKAECPRCGSTVDGEKVKEQAQAQQGGLPAQMYAVASKVPVRLTYRNGDVKVRYLWRFRAPTDEDLQAVTAAELTLARYLPQWEAQGLVPNEAIPEGEKTREPHNVGIHRWRDLFLPRQLLTNLVILEEIRAAQERVRMALPAEQAEAVAVYLAFMLDKVVNYNSVNTFWDYTRNKGAQTFSRHDFAFRSAFCEFEGARETVMWAANQVIGAYTGLCGLIHGGEVNLAGDDEDRDDDDDSASDIDDPDPEDADADETLSLHVQATGQGSLRPEVIVPTVTCEDAAALSMPAPGSVHLICVDPPYYNNVQYAELSNFFYVWMKRALKDWPGLAHFFTEPLAETNREAVANAARWRREADTEAKAWQTRYDAVFAHLRTNKIKAKEAKERALTEAGSKPLSAKDRADQFYENKMAAVFARGRKLLHPAGRMVVMFNHKQTSAWRSLGMALIRAGFEVRSSVPVQTEAESSLNIRGLDAARSTILLLCMPREEREQPTGNWAKVQTSVSRVARVAAARFREQGLTGTDMYLASLGPALGEVGRNWPVTDFAGRPVDLEEVLEEAYKAVGQWRMEQILLELNEFADLSEAAAGFSAEAVDRDTQTLWLWLDTFQGEIADSDEVRKLAKSLGVNPDDLKAMGLLNKDKELFLLRPPQEVDHRSLSRRLSGENGAQGRAAREADAWEERVFPQFMGAAVWNAVGLMMATEGAHGPEALRRWLADSGYGAQQEFIGAYAVTLNLLEKVFQRRRETDPWAQAMRQTRRGWDLVVSTCKP